MAKSITVQNEVLVETRKVVATVATVGLLAVTGACGKSDGSAGATSPGSTATTSDQPTETPSIAPNAAETITIKNFAFKVPASVSPGAKIVVKNEDSAAHTVTADGNGSFDVDVAGDGGSATFTAPTTPGTYMIKCKFHANMSGILVVK